MEIKKQLGLLNIIFALAGGISIVGGAIWFIRSNVWRPAIVIDSIDYANGIAQLHINGIPRTLYKNATLSAGAVWGVRFNGINPQIPDRIELVKNDLVYEVIV